MISYYNIIKKRGNPHPVRNFSAIIFEKVAYIHYFCINRKILDDHLRIHWIALSNVSNLKKGKNTLYK